MSVKSAVFVVAMFAVLLLGPAPAPAAPFVELTSSPESRWLWPVAPPAPVSRPFVAPTTSYAAGHRGIDLIAPVGTPVRAIADGTVSFAGVVADRPVLSLAHVGDLISSVEPVTALVTAGEHVARGQTIGVVASGGHCPPGCLHVGVRLHGQYISPLTLFGEVPRAILLPRTE